MNLPNGVKAVHYGDDFILVGRISANSFSDILLTLPPEDRNRAMGWIRYGGVRSNEGNQSHV